MAPSRAELEPRVTPPEPSYLSNDPPEHSAEPKPRPLWTPGPQVFLPVWWGPWFLIQCQVQGQCQASGPAEQGPVTRGPTSAGPIADRCPPLGHVASLSGPWVGPVAAEAS